MAQRTLHDGSTGDVVIRSGPPASGGGGGGGGSGGNRVGASGAFGGVSQRTKDARRRVKQAFLAAEARKRAEAAAEAERAREQARVQTREQLLAGWIPRYTSVRAAIDQRFSAKNLQLAPSLEQEILAARQHHDRGSSSERWQLYLISKEKSEIDGLITRKTSELIERKAAAHSFDGHDALSRSTNDYLARLDQFGDGLESGHQIWENAYNAAHEARLLSAQINALSEKSSVLSRYHAEQSIVWREREALWERQRQYAELREARVRFKQQADADARVERVNQANTLRLPGTASMAAASVLFNPNGVWIAGAADGLALAVTRSITALGGVLGTLTGRQVGIFIGAMAYSSELGNGELTPEQRTRLFHAIAVPAQALDLHDSRELQALADAGGSVEAEFRLKPVPVAEGTAVIVVGSGGEIDPRVPVLNAVLDPLTGHYSAEIPGSPTRYLQFAPEAMPQAAKVIPARLTVTEPQVQDIPAGVDLRIQDCIVCLPGLAPIYLSFSVPPMGTGVVTGTGQTAAVDWWNAASLANGAGIPTQVGEQFRGREFKSFEAFDEALWRTIGEHHQLVSPFDEVNQKRIEQGFAPYAPKSTWVGENRAFELRYQERPEFWSDPYNLDQISIKAPRTAEGWLGIVPADVPWPIPRPQHGNPWCRRAANTSGRRRRQPRQSIPWFIPATRPSRSYRKTRPFRLLMKGRLVGVFPGFRGIWIYLRPDWFSLARRLCRWRLGRTTS